MSKKKFNRVQVRYYAERKPYLYGMIHIVDGDLANQWWEKPFVISKKTADGREIVYGTVARTMENVRSQLDKLEEFDSDARRRLVAAGIEPIEGTVNQLPPCEITDRIIDEQDNLMEEVLLIVSVNVRVLSELLPSKMKKAKVAVYDYDSAYIDNIELSRIADLLLHNRYIMIRDQYVVDLISDEKFLSDRPQLGLKIDFDEYLGEVRRALEDLTVNDLIGRLRSAAKQLSSSSNVKDIVFLTQNLYTLGGLVMTDVTSVEGGPLKSILDRVAAQILDAGPTPLPGETRQVALVAGAPRFFLEPELDDKQIRVRVQVNGKPEELVMGYEDFFSEVSRAHGDARLLSSFRHTTSSK